ncbi:MAG: hypothetical protein U1E14_20665 [Geminicoccaceae bacterium]
MRESSDRDRATAPLRLAGWGFAGLAVLLLAWPAVRVPMRLVLAYNEGWNAYHASHWRDAAALYPEPTALLTNNYPPLSFVVVGILGDLLGDHVVAGRLVALLALLAVAWAVARLVRLASGPPAAGLAAGGWLCACVAIYASGYTAINDPQWLAHALLAAGLLLALGQHPAAAAGLTVAALLIKHTLLPLPLALTAVLVATDRRLALRWLGWGCVWGGIGAAAAWLTYGPALVRAILAAEGVRATSLANLAAVAWPMVPAVLPLLALVVLQAWRAREPLAWFAALYGLLALAFGLFIARAYGVAASAFLDLAIACALGGGLVLSAGWRGGRRRTVFVGAAVMALALLPGLPLRAYQQLQWLRTAPRDRADTEAAIAFLAARPAPVLCENLALCYWAGQPVAADFFNTGQKMLGGAIPPAALIEPVRARAFGAVQLERERPGNEATRRPGLGTNRLPVAVEDAIREAYPTATAFGRAGRVLTP